MNDIAYFKLSLPTTSKARKQVPLVSGLLSYFPAALAGVANTSFKGNEKHNPGEPLHHARAKSTDHDDCIVRHLMDVKDMQALLTRGDIMFIRIENDKGEPMVVNVVERLLDEANSLVWRALALSQELHEKYGGAPMAPGAK